MFAQVVAQVNSGDRSPVVVSEGHAWVVDLMDDVVELEHRTESGEFDLAAPCPVLLHVGEVLVNRLVVLNEGSKVISVRSDVIDCLLPVLTMQLLLPLQLIGN